MSQLAFDMGEPDDLGDLGPETFVQPSQDKSANALPPTRCECTRPLVMLDPDDPGAARCLRCGRGVGGS